MNILILSYGREQEIINSLKIANSLQSYNICMPTVVRYDSKIVKPLMEYRNFEVNVVYQHLFYYFFQDRFINEMSELEAYVSIDNDIEDIWKSFYRVVNFIESTYEEFKPDIIYSGSPDNYFVNLFIKIAEIKQVRFFWLEQSYFQQNGFTFFSDMAYSNDIFKGKIAQDSLDVEEFFKKDIIKSNPTMFMKNNIKKKIEDNIKYFQTINDFKSLDRLDLMLVPYISLPMNNFKNKLIRFKNSLSNNILLKRRSLGIEDIKFLSQKNRLILLALHYQPEAITLSAQPLFNNQYQLIKLISDILPPNYILLVKEHPLQNLGLRNPYVYRQITDKKNVKMVNQNIASNYLIDNGYIEKVMSIGGTIGFEEILRRRASMVFSDIYYSNFKYTFKADLNTIDTFIISMKDFLDFDYQKCREDYENELKIFLNKYYNGIIKDKTREESIHHVIENQNLYWS